MQSRVVLYELKELLLPDFKQFRDFLRMVIPPNEEDEKLIKIFVDMLGSIIYDIETADSIYDLREWFDVDELIDDWKNIKTNLTTRYLTLHSIDIFIFDIIYELKYIG